MELCDNLPCDNLINDAGFDAFTNEPLALPCPENIIDNSVDSFAPHVPYYTERETQSELDVTGAIEPCRDETTGSEGVTANLKPVTASLNPVAALVQSEPGTEPGVAGPIKYQLVYNCAESGSKKSYLVAGTPIIALPPPQVITPAAVSTLQDAVDAETNEQLLSASCLLSQQESIDVPVQAEHYNVYFCDSPGCGRSFTSTSYLKYHQAVHRAASKSSRVKCSFDGCGRIFSWPAHLAYHELTHTNTRQYSCPLSGCEASFYTPQRLRVHYRTHTGEKPYQCQHCSKAFTTAGNLTNHERIHTGERPFQCDNEGCKKSFAEQSSLRKHQLTHTKTKSFICDLCGKSFSQSSSRNLHRKRHQSAPQVTESESSPQCDSNNVSEDIHQNEVAGGISYPVDITPTGKSNSNIEVNEYFCECCGKCFSESQTRDMHMKECHHERLDNPMNISNGTGFNAVVADNQIITHCTAQLDYSAIRDSEPSVQYSGVEFSNCDIAPPGVERIETVTTQPIISTQQQLETANHTGEITIHDLHIGILMN